MLALHTIATTCSHFSLLHCMCWFKCYPVLCTCTYILLHFVIQSRAVNTWLCTLCVQPFHAQAVLPRECDHPVCTVHAGPARQGTTRLLPFVHQVLIQQTASLSLTQCVCTCIPPAHGLFGLSNIPSAPLHTCCHEPPSGPQTLHAFPISLNHFLCQRPHSTQTCTPQAFYLC